MRSTVLRPVLRPAPWLAIALLAGCATAPKQATKLPPAAPGMERLMGQTVDAAIAILGPASLDRREGPARQLQFAGACILDLFFYPKAGTGTVATYAEARMPDGKDFPAGDCLAILLRSKPG